MKLSTPQIPTSLEGWITDDRVDASPRTPQGKSSSNLQQNSNDK